MPVLPHIHIKKLFEAGRHPRPVRDWFVLVSSATVLIGLSVGWNTWSYMKVTRMSPQTSIPTMSEHFSTSTIGAVEQAFLERKVEADNYRSTYRFVDPSR